MTTELCVLYHRIQVGLRTDSVAYLTSELSNPNLIVLEAYQFASGSRIANGKDMRYKTFLIQARKLGQQRLSKSRISNKRINTSK